MPTESLVFIGIGYQFRESRLTHIRLYSTAVLIRPVKDILLRLADRAQDAVKGYKGNYGERVGMGAYGAPTSAIDAVAERAILDELDRIDERLNVLSEEAGFIDRGGDKTLVIDPVDGTHNAARGLPAYSTSLAIGVNSMDDTQFGLVRDLVSGKDYFATKGGGAFLDDAPLQVRAFNPKDTLFTVYLGSNADERALELTRKVRRIRSLGAASLDMCLVASGAADVYYMNSTAVTAELRVVDIAASALILREAGGEVLTMDRKRLNMPYDSKTRSNLIAYGDPRALELIP